MRACSSCLLLQAAIVVLSLMLGACPSGANDTRDATIDSVSDAARDTGIEVFVNSPACPDEAFVFRLSNANGGVVGLPEAGIDCHYPARACSPGELPDNVCHCTVDGRFSCRGHLRSCLPFGPEDFGFTADSRPAPKHRAASEACADPASVVRRCEPRGDVEPECATDDDCMGAAICLGQHVYRGDDGCGCFEIACQVDDDCGVDALCECGSIRGDASCNGSEGGAACGHQCLPADCRTDADCGVGGWCSPSPAECGLRPEQWACHYAGRDECLTDEECSRNGTGTLCRFDAGAWACGGRFCVVE